MKLAVTLFVCGLMLCGCSWNKKQPQPTPTPTTAPSASPTIDPSIAEASDVVGETTSFGTPIVSVQLIDGKIHWLSIDELTENTTKKTMGDEYKLGEQAIASWAEQIKNLEDYIVKNGVAGIETDAEGKAANEDLRSQCTISIRNYLNTVEKAVDQAGKPKEPTPDKGQ